MDQTTHLKLPYILAAQSQKHVTHNEALRALDAIVQLAVADKDLSAPPGSPADGDRYIVAASPSGAWAGHAGHIAAYQDGAWAFYEPAEGWCAWVVDEGALYVRDGGSWGVAASGGGGLSSVNPIALVGVNATADTTDRLKVSSPATLFDHEGSDHRFKINKSTASDTASVLFQTGYSGRAEFGLAGDDDFHVKVSADGSAWSEALVISRSTGAVRAKSGQVDVASAATCDIGAAAAERVRITGTTTITSLGTAAYELRHATFAGALTLTHNGTSLILPGAANITTAAGDTAMFASDGSGNWRCLAYQRAARATAFSDIKQAASTSATGVVELATNAETQTGTDTDRAVTPASLRSATRELLVANRTYYVRTDGSDSNSGLANTSGGAFLTVQHALDACNGLDFGGYKVTVSVGAGSFSGKVTIPALVGVTDSSKLEIAGAGAASTTLTYAGAYIDSTLYASGSGIKATISSLKVVNSYGSSAGCAINAEAGAQIVIGSGVEIGQTGWIALRAQTNGVIIAISGLTVSSNAVNIFGVQFGGYVELTGTFALGTRTVTATAAAETTGVIFANAATFTGTVTGSRYSAIGGGVIQTNGGGASYFPGSSAGSTATGGQYL